ncbi:hypothetical protein IF1G_10782 [Cordyceps javanica]|uniref:Uncharacterized protein n=1 Tax=Cordyceps javanica TaxID=43265 RepID=A0A545UMF1_9HYPO|nr:hypothetical protein IF1G_10782 [Cordyceps javanica]
MQVHWPLQSQDAMGFPSLGVSWQNMVLSRDFSQTGKEGDALQYYTSLYPAMTISKSVHWSSYMIMLRHSSQEPMVMHLLIAASLMDLATSQNNNTEFCVAAQTHAKSGLLLLKEAMKPDTSPDPVSVIIASFFLYRYMGVAHELDPLHMTEWSESVFNYIKRNCLDSLCTGATLTAAEPLASPKRAAVAITHSKKAHMARLMVWTFYEDIFANIQGYGGSLARHLCEKSERAREVYQYSGAELESSWGEDYPEREILDDVENAPIITFLYDVMALYAEVNRVIDSLPSSAADKAVVEEKIEKLEVTDTTYNHKCAAQVPCHAQCRLYGAFLLCTEDILLPELSCRRRLVYTKSFRHRVLRQLHSTASAALFVARAAGPDASSVSVAAVHGWHRDDRQHSQRVGSLQAEDGKVVCCVSNHHEPRGRDAKEDTHGAHQADSRHKRWHGRNIV